MKEFFLLVADKLEQSSHILIAGLSGGIIRVRAMATRKEPLNFLKIVIELLSAAICSYYIGEPLLSIIPVEFKWSDNFIYFIAGYGGMNLVDFLYQKFFKK